jgi:hypothetical protein
VSPGSHLESLECLLGVSWVSPGSLLQYLGFLLFFRPTVLVFQDLQVALPPTTVFWGFWLSTLISGKIVVINLGSYPPSYTLSKAINFAPKFHMARKPGTK